MDSIGNCKGLNFKKDWSVVVLPEIWQSMLEEEMFKQSCPVLSAVLVRRDWGVSCAESHNTIQYHSTTPSYSHHARLLNKITNKSVGQWSCCNVFYIDNGYAGLGPWSYQSDDIKSVLITTKTSRQAAGPNWYGQWGLIHPLLMPCRSRTSAQSCRDPQYRNTWGLHWSGHLRYRSQLHLGCQAHTRYERASGHNPRNWSAGGYRCRL